MKKKFLFVTTSRADYSQSKNLILKFKRKIPKNFFLLVSGSHLSKKYGKTINEILNDRIKPDFKIDILSEKNLHINDNNKIVEIAFKKFNNFFSKFKPDLIIVACGFDASGVDPLSRMLCGSDTFKEMTKAVMQLARDNCDGKLVMAHEGGYSELHAPFCGHAVLEEMSGSLIEVPDPLHARISGQQPSNEFNEFVFGHISEIEVQIFGESKSSK